MCQIQEKQQNIRNMEDENGLKHAMLYSELKDTEAV